MAAPTLENTWYTRGNSPLPDITTNDLAYKSFLWSFKAHLCNNILTGTTGGVRPGGSVWTVAGSSDGTTAGMDATDRWGTSFTAANLTSNFSGSPHSWIVLSSPVALGVHFCIDLNVNSANNTGFIVSKQPFTGGSITSRPTAPNEWAFQVTSTPNTSTSFNWTNETNISTPHYTSFSVMSNGEFHIVAHRQTTNIFYTFFALRTSVDAQVGDQSNIFALAHQTNGGRGAGQIVSALAGSSGCIARRVDNSAIATNGGLLTYSWGNAQFADIAGADVITGAYTAFPFHVMSVESGYVAYRGRIPDLWVLGAPPVGGSYPTTGSPTQHVVGSTLVPLSVVPQL